MTAIASDHRVLHLVCVGRRRDMAPTPPDDASPLGTAARLIHAGELAALAADVDAAEFLGPDAEQRLADLQWLTPRALAHESLISKAMAHGPVLPMRFGTVFSSEHTLREALDRHAPAIADFLGQVEGHAEHAARSTGAQTTPPPLTSASRPPPKSPRTPTGVR
ncbi:GvpL/GvpF family gas vesicle protein [Leptolyngbya sp. 15MV]|nr:GvpL/GvpF family gas vesicle protein [Leptolyngbya sp. 15MV]